MRNFLLVLVILSFTTKSFAQSTVDSTKGVVNLIGTYLLTFRIDSTSQDASTEKMQLLLSNNFSVFESVNKIIQDSTTESMASSNTLGGDNGNMGLSITRMLKTMGTKFSYKIYKMYHPNKCIIYDNIIRDNYKYEETSYPLIWQITSTTASIAGFKCSKATTSFAGRHYEAWFTREIPISDGPYKFSGLPGLIIKVNDTTNSYVFELLSLVKPAKVYIVKFPPGKVSTTTKATFFKASKEMREHAVDLAPQYNVTIKNPDAVRAHLAERMKHANNPVELKY